MIPRLPHKESSSSMCVYIFDWDFEIIVIGLCGERWFETWDNYFTIYRSSVVLYSLGKSKEGITHTLDTLESFWSDRSSESLTESHTSWLLRISLRVQCIFLCCLFESESYSALETYLERDTIWVQSRTRETQGNITTARERGGFAGLCFTRERESTCIFYSYTITNIYYIQIYFTCIARLR